MLDFTRIMLISTQVEVVVEVGVELGKSSCFVFNAFLKKIAAKELKTSSLDRQKNKIDISLQDTG